MNEPITELERLRALEWSAHEVELGTCPVCLYATSAGHEDTCWLGQRIRELEEQREALRRAGAAALEPQDRGDQGG